MTETDAEAGTSASSIPRRMLGRMLRRAREATVPKISMAAAAAHLKQNQLSLRRLEQGRVSIPEWKVEKLAGLYGVPELTQAVMLALARDTRARGGWWHSYGDAMPEWFEMYIGLEATASRIRAYDPLLVNGLLQHPAYMDAVIRADLPELDEEQRAARVELRRSRQRLLTRAFPPAPLVEVILGEAALMADPPRMREQLWHLLKATELPNVTIRVLPLRAGPVRGAVAGAWALLDFPPPDTDGATAEPSTVYSENLTGAVYLDKPREIVAYETVWEALCGAALDENESIDVMGCLLKELTDRER